jgi:S-phase kinase-associated protein 1
MSVKTVKLESSDETKAVFEVPLEVISLSTTIKNMIDDLGEDMDSNTPIPLNNVTARNLERAINFCTHHAEANPKGVKDAEPAEGEQPKKPAEMDEWETAFVTMDQGELFELILAANYLDIKPMLDLTCKAVANMIKGKSPEEIRKTFNIKNDFTPEEEEKIRKENEWCEDVV